MMYIMYLYFRLKYTKHFIDRGDAVLYVLSIVSWPISIPLIILYKFLCVVYRILYPIFDLIHNFIDNLNVKLYSKSKR